jgi:cysteinyl-tRNA synthetase
MSRRMEEFVPSENGIVRMYTCGPTVYDYAHIGNFRAYMFEDVLRRYLKFCGFKVTQVMNLTDVDDKTIKGSAAAGVPLEAFTGKFVQAFFEDLAALGIERAEQYPAATRHVPEMIALIERLFKAGYAYKSDDGSVYYNVGKFKDYGKLAHLDRGGLRAGARVAQDEYDKENVADFALWKAWDERDGDTAWDSPWGRGRPVWHIECSAMSMKYLGESFDLHTGGVDNVFPHHENEIAQSEGATGKPFVKYWMHCGYLVVDGKKMSKSLGNFHTLRQILAKGYSGREVRYALMSAHYRQSLNFTFDALDGARASLSRIDEFMDRVKGACGAQDSRAAASLPDWAGKARAAFVRAMDDDLNVPEALAALFDMVRDGNCAIDSGKLSPADACAVVDLMEDLDRVLGFVTRDEDRPGREALDLVESRQRMRAQKRWKDSDAMRDRLAGLGWTVQDTPRGPRLRKKAGTI